MNVRIFWVRAMKCMCAQTRPRFILSSERVLGGMEFEPMLTPRENSPLPENFPRGGSNPRRCGQRAQALPSELFRHTCVITEWVCLVFFCPFLPFCHFQQCCVSLGSTRKEARWSVWFFLYYCKVPCKRPPPLKHKFHGKVGGGRLLGILPFVQSIIQPLKVQVNTKRLEFKQKSYLFQF